MELISKSNGIGNRCWTEEKFECQQRHKNMFRKLKTAIQRPSLPPFHLATSIIDNVCERISNFWLSFTHIYNVNWPYCWWWMLTTSTKHCSRVSHFSIYVAFSIIKDSYHIVILMQFFSQQRENVWVCWMNGREQKKRRFVKIKLMMTCVQCSM